MRILVADDFPVLRLLVRRTLDGHEVFEAGTGDEALQLLDTARPSVAILDVNMPGGSGLDVCRAIRRDPAWAATVVIVITANGAMDAEQQALEPVPMLSWPSPSARVDCGSWSTGSRQARLRARRPDQRCPMGVWGGQSGAGSPPSSERTGRRARPCRTGAPSDQGHPTPSEAVHPS